MRATVELGSRQRPLRLMRPAPRHHAGRLPQQSLDMMRLSIARHASPAAISFSALFRLCPEGGFLAEPLTRSPGTDVWSVR